VTARRDVGLDLDVGDRDRIELARRAQEVAIAARIEGSTELD